jgi:hypothetical protein|tara:strand:+ start:13 stop:252 length:240 start_codon:yes stop_codon:yes gene_type:complete
MPWPFLSSVAAHHGEAADPDLLEQIKNLLDHLLGVGPWTIVVGLGVVILLMPLSIVAFYLVQKRRHSSAGPRRPDRGET